MDEIRYVPIGVIHSPFTIPEGTPVQAAGAEGIEGSVVVFDEYVDGLEDLDGFSHVMLLYHFHLSRGVSLTTKPFLDDEEHGIFAIRGTCRPNPIGISVVRLLGIDGNVLSIRDVDIVDGTPLLDIKPYVPEFDARKADRIGWLENRVGDLSAVRDDGRFTG